MPNFHTDTFELPFSGVEPIARHCSYAGATSASERVGRQCLQLLTVYAAHGPLTDQEAEDITGIQRSSVIPRRRSLIMRGLVQAIGSKKERAGIRNTTWGLTR